jgi:dTDP-4-dehydrorhamnose reductase
MTKPVVIVTGAHGQLGKEIQAISIHYPAFRFLFLSKEDLQLDQFESVKKYFDTIHPAWCINCAAYTAVDRAETEKELAMRINGDAVGYLAGICKLFNTKLIHISTDYVFDGTAVTPYNENHATNPVNYYGQTKLEGEKLCFGNNPESIIIRTSWVYSEFGNNFVKTMMRLMKERASLNVVNDQVGSPTYAADLAKLILDIIGKSEEENGAWKPGIFHYSNQGVISWYDFAVAIKDMTGSNCNIHAIPTSSYPTPAARPAYSVFNKEKIKDTYGIHIPEWKDSLKLCIAKM